MSAENSCGCGCKPLSEADIRRIVREEIVAALSATMRAEGRHMDATRFEAAALGLTDPSLKPPGRHPFQLTPEQLHRVVENFNRGRRSEP